MKQDVAPQVANAFGSGSVGPDSIVAASGSATGFRRHQFARADPVMFIHGPKIAGARPTVATLPI